MYEQSQVPQAAAGMKEPTPIERVVHELEQLNRRLDSYAGGFQQIADRWLGPQPPRSLADERAGVGMPTLERAPNVAPPGRLQQLEQLLRSAHGCAQAIENQLDRLRVL